MTDHKHHIIIVVTLVSMAGCNIQFGWGDPCATDENGNFTNPSYNGLTPSEQAACSECGQIDCTDAGTETGETGETGEDDDSPSLTCEVQVESADQLGWEPGPWLPVWCLDGIYPTAIPPQDLELPELEHRSKDSCGALTKPFPCRRSWTESAFDAGDECRLCEPRVEQPGPAPDRVPLSTNDGWRLCHNTSQNGWPQWYPTEGLIGSAPQSDWGPSLECGEWERYACPKGHVGISNPTIMTFTAQPLSQGQEYTCACESDSDCQPGAVCEAGWTIEGMFPHPTLCAWDDGTPNGPAPSGPTVYGLGDWSEGITVNGNAITMTPAMLVAAIGTRAALFNDSQSLEGELGSWVITRCEDDSLCAHLGLGIGDEVEFDIDDAGELIEGATKFVAVFRDGADVQETWTVRIGGLQ